MTTPNATLAPEDLPLQGQRIRLARGAGYQYARDLLHSLGAAVVAEGAGAGPAALHPQVLWARSGAMLLTGASATAPLCCPVPLAECARGTLSALAALAGKRPVAEPERLLSERAAISALRRQGSVAPGGSCRLLRARDGHIAVNLPRAEDWSLLGAWLAGPPVDSWNALAARVGERDMANLLERGALVGLALAPAHGIAKRRSWLNIPHVGKRGAPRNAAPRVIDLSSLWAGPLCGHILGLLGAEVIKVESIHRPDGARAGPERFFDLLNAGKASVAVDLTSGSGREQLRLLLGTADIVIESSRPRALQQMDVWAEQLIDARPGLTWLSITGYGRNDADGMRVAYGDDAGVAAGLTAALQRSCGALAICGDAIADPLTGMHGALAAWASWQSGGGRLIDLALCDVVQQCAEAPSAPKLETVAMADGWYVIAGDEPEPVREPYARAPGTSAVVLGADTQRILSGAGIRC